MRRMFAAFGILFALVGCVNTPSTKALITPIGAVGYHKFAPPDSPDRIQQQDLERAIAAANASERRDGEAL